MEKFKGFKPHSYPNEAPAKRPDLQSERSANTGSENTENTPEALEAIKSIREILDTVDQETLFDIFREYYGRVGNNPDSLALTDINKVGIVYDKESDAGEHSLAKGPTLNAAKLFGKPDLIINTLIHEYAHEASGLPAVAETHSNGLNLQVTTKQQGGVQTDTIEGRKNLLIPFWPWKKEEISSNQSINEGITVIIANDIYNEYLRRTGEGSKSPERKLYTETGFDPISYPIDQLNAQVYIAFLSIASGIPEDKVKEGVLRTYFRNSDIVPEEFNELVFDLTKEKGLGFEEFMKTALHNPTRDDMYDTLNSVGKPLWGKLIESLPIEKREALKTRIKELLKRNSTAHAVAV